VPVVAVQHGDTSRLEVWGLRRILWASNVSRFYQWWIGSPSH